MSEELSTLLERAAADPRGEPRVTAPDPGAGHARAALSAAVLGLVVVLAVAGLIVAVTRGSGGSRPSTTSTAAGVRTEQDGVAVVLPAGWRRSSTPAAPWLSSPHEVMALADAPIARVPDDGANHAACPSEIPQAGVDAARAGGAFVWIGDLRGGASYDPPPARPRSFADAPWQPLCAIPGFETRGTTFTEAGRDLVVSVVIRDGATPDTRRQVDELLDSMSVASR